MVDRFVMDKAFSRAFPLHHGEGVVQIGGRHFGLASHHGWLLELPALVVSSEQCFQERCRGPSSGKEVHCGLCNGCVTGQGRLMQAATAFINLSNLCEALDHL